jgi:hypothetical protein
MSLKLGGHLFTGPFPIESTEIRANMVPVIFAIIAKGGKPWAPEFRVIDFGSSPDQGLRLADHPRREHWMAEGGENIAAYLFNTPHSQYTTADRERMVEELSRQYQPPNDRVV